MSCVVAVGVQQPLRSQSFNGLEFSDYFTMPKAAPPPPPFQSFVCWCEVDALLKNFPICIIIRTLCRSSVPRSLSPSMLGIYTDKVNTEKKKKKKKPIPTSIGPSVYIFTHFKLSAAYYGIARINFPHSWSVMSRVYRITLCCGVAGGSQCVRVSAHRRVNISRGTQFAWQGVTKTVMYPPCSSRLWRPRCAGWWSWYPAGMT